MAQHNGLRNKFAVITGASSGMGRETALALARSGCDIFMIARRKEKLEELKNIIAGMGVHVSYAAGDVTDAEFVKKAIRRACGGSSKPDILILSAGQAFIRPFNLTGSCEFRRLMEINTFGVVNVCKEVTARMNSGGSIVIISSPAGICGAKGMSAYALSKGGLAPFGKSLALELAPLKIRVNIISPGYIETEMTKSLYSKLSSPQLEAIIKAHPLGAGSLKDIVNAIKFLVSDESAWITGAVLAVDGGFSAGI